MNSRAGEGMKHKEIHQLSRIKHVCGFLCVCVCRAADWDDVEGADAVLKGP